MFNVKPGQTSKYRDVEIVGCTWCNATGKRVVDGGHLAICPECDGAGDVVITPLKTAYRVLVMINSWYELHQSPPTIHRLAALLQLKSTASVHYHIAVLRDLGLVNPSRGKPLAITPAGWQALKEIWANA